MPAAHASVAGLSHLDLALPWCRRSPAPLDTAGPDTPIEIPLHRQDARSRTERIEKPIRKLDIQSPSSDGATQKRQQFVSPPQSGRGPATSPGRQAERGGFEPPNGTSPLLVFETSPINRSGTSPCGGTESRRPPAHRHSRPRSHSNQPGKLIVNPRHPPPRCRCVESRRKLQNRLPLR